MMNLCSDTLSYCYRLDMWSAFVHNSSKVIVSMQTVVIV